MGTGLFCDRLNQFLIPECEAQTIGYELAHGGAKRPVFARHGDTEQFTGIAPKATLNLVELAETVRNAGIKLTELDYILTGNGGDLTEAQVAQTLISLRASLEKIEIDYPLVEDATQNDEPILRSLLGLYAPPENVDLLFGIVKGSGIFSVKRSNNFFDDRY